MFFLNWRKSRKIIDAEPKFITFMTSPSIKQEDKLAMIKHITDGASEVTTNLLDMLFDYGRIANLEDVIDEFNRLNDEFEKTVRVKVTTAIELMKIKKKNLHLRLLMLLVPKKSWLIQ